MREVFCANTKSVKLEGDLQKTVSEIKEKFSGLAKPTC